MTSIGNGAVLPQEARELMVEPGVGIDEGLIGVPTPSSHGSLPSQSNEIR